MTLGRSLCLALPVGVLVLFGCAGDRQLVSESRSETGAMATLPNDIHPQTRSRLSQLKRDELDETGRRLYDSVLDPKRPTLAGFQGPAGIWLHSPKVGEPIREFNRILRNEVALEPRLRELAILVTARELDQQFEWTAHEPAALKEGLEPAIIDAVKHRRPASGLGPREAAIVRFGRELIGERKVSSETYAETVKLFGETGVVNLAALMANYALTAVMLTAFDQQLHEGQRPLLPPR
jgi:4-carboxymuconolactone decarboxylase